MLDLGRSTDDDSYEGIPSHALPAYHPRYSGPAPHTGLDPQLRACVERMWELGLSPMAEYLKPEAVDAVYKAAAYMQDLIRRGHSTHITAYAGIWLDFMQLR